MRMAIVGCGMMAENHIRAVRKMKNPRIVAVCDKDVRLAANMARRWNIGNHYNDFSQMLAEEDLSIVSLCTPPDTHASLAIEAIRNGTNILVEKPLTMSTLEAEQIVQSLKNSAVKLTVDYNMLLSKAMMKALSLVRKKVLGEVLAMRTVFLQRKDDYMASNESHWCHKLPGGRFGEMLSHPIYLLQSVLGNDLKVDRIYQDKRGSYSWMRGDELHISLRKERGFGNIYVSFNAPRTVVELEIYGTERILRVDLMSQIVMSLGSRTEGKTGAAIDTVSLSSKLLSSTVSNAATYLLRERGEYPLQTVYSDLVGSIDEDRDPMVTPYMAYNTVRIAEEICSAL
jgi:predicted dehydrogenase